MSDPDETPLVVTWFGEARYGRAREVVAWLHEQVVPQARAAEGCLSAEAYAEDGDGHEVLLVTRWRGVDEADGWEVPDHPALWSGGESRWLTIEDAAAALAADP